MNKQNKVTFSFLDKDKYLIEQVEKIAKRERRTVSNVIILALEEYIPKHGEDHPNFQQTLMDQTKIKEKSIAYIQDKVFKEFVAKYDWRKEVEYREIVRRVKAEVDDSVVVANVSPKVSKLLAAKGFKVFR